MQNHNSSSPSCIATSSMIPKYTLKKCMQGRPPLLLLIDPTIISLLCTRITNNLPATNLSKRASTLYIFKNEEAYVCIYSHREGDTILFTPEGGVDIGDVDAKAEKMEVDVDADGVIDAAVVAEKLLKGVAKDKQEFTLAEFKKIVPSKNVSIELFLFLQCYTC